MAEPPSPPNGAAAWRPSLPTAVVVVSVAVALVAVSGLLYLLYTRTTGPGQILRDFVQAVEASDCAESYGLLDPSLRTDPDVWCDQLDTLARQVDPRFEVRRVVLEGNVALVRVVNPDGELQAWELGRDGRSWRILGARRGVTLPG